MAENILPTTELEAVNEMLRAISVSPVATLDDSTIVDAVMAKETLKSVMKAFQTKGWHWNSDYDWSIQPDTNNEIKLPLTAASVDPSSSQWKDYVWRGSRLWDRESKTYKIPETVKVDIIWFLGFEEMPEHVRRYVLVAAVRKFQDEIQGDEALHSYTSSDENRAWVSVLDAEAEAADYNVLRDNRTVARVARVGPLDII